MHSGEPLPLVAASYAGILAAIWDHRFVSDVMRSALRLLPRLMASALFEGHSGTPAVRSPIGLKTFIGAECLAAVRGRQHGHVPV
jgi:hypothetical protein